VTDAYAALAALAVRERELADEGRLDELETLAAERAALVAALPAQAPPHARPALLDAVARQAEAEAALRRAVAGARAELAALDKGRRASRAYGPGSSAEAAGPTLKFSA
jgi:hypothetical protein